MKSVTLLSQALNSVIERKRNETSRSEIKYFQGLFIQGKPAQLALLARFTRLTWPMPCFLMKLCLFTSKGRLALLRSRLLEPRSQQKNQPAFLYKHNKNLKRN